MNTAANSIVDGTRSIEKMSYTLPIDNANATGEVRVWMDKTLIVSRMGEEKGISIL